MAEIESQHPSTENALCVTDRAVFPVTLSTLTGLVVHAFRRLSCIFIDALLETQAEGAHDRSKCVV